MELRTLQYFFTVAREENITRASEVLHITQPTLSRQMKQLEQELGTELFVRQAQNDADARRHAAAPPCRRSCGYDV